MRTQAERDEQTLDIASALLAAALVWLLPVVVIAVVVSLAGLEISDDVGAAVTAVVLLGFAVSVVRRLAGRR